VTNCIECNQPLPTGDTITIDYSGAGNFELCSIDCVFKHVVLEIMADDRTTSEISLMLYDAERIHEENQ